MEFIAKLFALIAVLIVAVLGVVGYVFLFSAIGAIVTLVAVNFLINPAILVLLFGVTKLTFWKAFALNLVAATLFQSTNVNSK